MSETDEISGFLSEFSASLSQDTQEAFQRRINAERMIKLLSDELIEQHEAESIRVLPDRRLAGKDAADFLVQVDDYDLRLILLDAPEGKLSVTPDHLREWADLLEANPSTNLVIAVWTDDELSALSFSMAQLQSLTKSPEQLRKVLAEVRPLRQVISDVIRHQIKIWDVAKDLAGKPSAQSRDIYSVFAEKISRAIDVEVNRHYRTEERLQAARNYPYEQEKRAILSVLQEALSGTSSKDLQMRLTSLPRRGVQ